jgi:hypothetical protein
MNYLLLLTRSEFLSLFLGIVMVDAVFNELASAGSRMTD